MPGWVAVIEQVPVATKVAKPPDTVHTPGVLEVKIRARFELADARSPRVMVCPTAKVCGPGKLMTCGVFPVTNTLNVTVTDAAGM